MFYITIENTILFCRIFAEYYDAGLKDTSVWFIDMVSYFNCNLLK